MSGPSEKPRNPYIGPRAFEEDESDLFFGRDSEIEILTGLVMARRAALLFAPSGAGKSSLLKAGLIPELARQETVGRGRRARSYQQMRVLPVLTVGGAIPGGMEQPIANVYVFRALLCLQRDADPEDLAGQTLVEALAPFFGQPEPDGQFPHASISPPTTLLIFDQFEEIFTHDPTRRQEREGFFQQVNQALQTYPTLHVLFAMREDYIAELTPYAVILPEQLRPRFRLEFLGETAALLAIQQPAGRAGVEFTAAAAATLALDLRRVRVQRLDGTMDEQVGDYVEPVQLQVVCHRLWQKLPAGATQVVEADLEAVGDVDNALAGYYAERVMATASKTGVSERAIRDWCDRHLITEQGIRGQVLQGRDESQGLANAAIWRLVDAHLVRAEKRRGATWFELAHDRLIEPVRVDNVAWREANLSPLQRQAALWQDEDRPEGLLLRSQALTEARDWAESHQDELTHLEQEFIDESVKAGRLQSAKRLRVLLLGAAAVVVLLAALAILAFLGGEEARQHEATALAAGTAESEAKETAILAQHEAMSARDDAWAAATAEAKSKGTAVAAQQTAEEDRYVVLTSLANARTSLNLAQEQLAVAGAQMGTIQALEATNQALLDSLAPTPTDTTAPTPTLPGSTQWPTATPTPSTVPIPLATPTPNLAATAAAEAIQSQWDQVQAMETALARCPFEPQGEFQELWKGDEIRLRLGCPKQPRPIPGYWAEQPFQNGYMYWSQSPDLYIVIIGNDIGQWYLFPTEEIRWPSNPSGVSCPADLPPDLYQPVRGFGGLWCANPEIQKEIGFATDKEQGVNGNLLQEFERGLIFRDSQGSIYILFRDDGTYVRDMVFVSGGQLSIGSPEDKGRNLVPVSGFWLDRYEVTNAEYKKCVEAKRCRPPRRRSGSLEVTSSTRQDYYTNSRFDRFPVIFVDWNDARAYCRWVSKRLPTEAEWEWAAKGPNGYRYPWGNEAPSASRANYNEDWKDTRRVGQYEPTAAGLYDMAGNVWEWTSSLNWEYPYLPHDGREDPEAEGDRVIRGGSWRDGPDNLRTVNRNHRSPENPFDNIGFRCVMAPQ